MPRRALAVLTPVLAFAVAAPLAGCSIVSSDNHVAYSGNYVASDTFSRVKVGESTPSYVEATLGEPTSKTDLEDGSSIWRWDYVVRRSGEGSVLLVFDGESSSEKKHSSYVQFADGVATKKWRS